MDLFRIGVTSPLAAGEMLAPTMGATRHCIALERARANPIILRKDMDAVSVIENLALRGIVFSGGGDICAARYGGNEALIQDDTDLQRDAFEFVLMERALEIGIPILAVCRGMQIANVVLGGTLIEDLRHRMGAAYRLPHHQVNDAGRAFQEYAHTIKIVPQTLLHDIVETERFPVNSIHHQALGELAPVFQASAHADDGVIEAIEFSDSRKSFFVGVQWHPEWLPDDPFSALLYARLLQACEPA